MRIPIPSLRLLFVVVTAGTCLCPSTSEADDQVIGLCYRDGTSGVVLEELFKAEGVPFVRLHDLDRLETLNLKGLVLGEGFDDSAKQAKGFVEKGGVLLSLKPGGPLAGALGLKSVGTQKDGYLCAAGKGSLHIGYNGRLQLFGQATLYEGGECLVPLDPRSRHGGIIRVDVGSGTALAVAFDLPATLMAIMQPESECGKSVDVSRVEYDLGDAPQVDLMRRLLVGVLFEQIDVPLMRKWYFPSRYKTMVAITGDQDGASFEMMKVVRDIIKEIDAPYTLFVLQNPNKPITTEQFKLLADGSKMDFALHEDFVSPGKTFDEKTFNEELGSAEAAVGHKLTGSRPHCIRWQSPRELPTWAERAGVQYGSSLGIRCWQSKPPKDGYWLGTGLPYRYIHPDDYRRMDVLEIPIFDTDNIPFWKPMHSAVNYKQGTSKTFVFGLGLTEDEAFKIWKRFIDQAIDKYPTAWCCCWHPVYLAKKQLEHKLKRLAKYYSTDTHFRKCITYAKQRGVGLTGTNALNDFWRAREKVAMKHIKWDSESATAEYRVSGEVKVDALTLVTPLEYRGKKASISVNGRPRNFTEARCLERQQAMFTIDVRPEEEMTVRVQYR